MIDDADAEAGHELDALVARVREGDREAFRGIVLQLQQEVRCYLAWRTVSLDLVEEVLQETFIAVYEDLGSYESRGTFRRWVRGIARHRLLRALRDRQREHRHRVPGGGAVLDRLVAEVAAERENEGEDVRGLVRRLEGCLARLSARNRQLLQLHHGADVALGELARRFSLSETALASRLYRLRRQLRSCLGRERSP